MMYVIVLLLDRMIIEQVSVNIKCEAHETIDRYEAQ